VRPFIPEYQMVGYFDGAAKDGAGGCGFILYINKDHYYRGWMGIDTCTNNLSELTAVWSLLYWARRLNIRELKIYGDSLIVIDWLQGKTHIKATYLIQ